MQLLLIQLKSVTIYRSYCFESKQALQSGLQFSPCQLSSVTYMIHLRIQLILLKAQYNVSKGYAMITLRKRQRIDITVTMKTSFTVTMKTTSSKGAHWLYKHDTYRKNISKLFPHRCTPVETHDAQADLFHTVNNTK